MSAPMSASLSGPKVYAIGGVTPVIDPSAFVHPTAVLIGDVIIGPRCYVGPVMLDMVPSFMVPAWGAMRWWG